jgi:UDP-N-acetylmuramyl pentapeptide phosphotransferase/UDP-N-acetylglucosamine-1-phosphate transferase
MVNYLLVFLTAFGVAILIVITQGWHGHYSMDSSFGVQKIHVNDTPRIGGIAIILGLITAWLMAAPGVKAILEPMLLAGIPALSFGFAEDITKKVGVLPRLLATMGSGVLAWYLTGVAMQNTGFPPIDWLLQSLPLAVLFTAFAVGGVANAINIIDGFNGLAAGSLAIMLAAMGFMALNLADVQLASVCFLVAACALGFGLVNWPLGKLFLGDGGAYLLGFCLAWIAVLLPMRHPEINAWATILVCAYPVLEVVFSVLRRRKRDGHHPGQPDKVHLHHLLHRRVVCQLFPQLDATLKNGMTSPLCWVLVSVPAAWAVVFAQNTPMLVAALFALVMAYSLVYQRLAQFRWGFSTPKPRPSSPAHSL